MYKYSLLALLLLCVSVLPLAAQQGPHPIKWSFDSKDLGNGQFELIETAEIKDGWTTYSQFLESEDGPVATQFVFQDGPHFRRVGKAEESGEKYTTYDKIFGMNLTKFKHKAIFTQKVEVKDPSKPITGYITSMCCDDGQCLPPTDKDFSITVKPTAPVQGTPAPGTPDTKQGQGSVIPPVTTPGSTEGVGTVSPVQSPDKQGVAITPTTENNSTPIAGQTPVTINEGDTNMRGAFDSRRDINAAQYINKCDDGAAQHDGSLWMIFLWGMLFGFAAVLTPCIFPMIPVTVGFFVKRTKDRATGLRNAIWYGLSIVLIYLAIGIGLTSAFGPTVLNEMSTNMWFNLVFFAVFFIFALSFFGFFEITLPNSWINASDRMADKGGALGIFFMAFTLALVSFSCTGPLVGSLLVETASTNQGDQIFGFIPARPFAGLLGFGLALALPFALFAMFPGWLKSLPKSGGWMDNVKITLGFVELALAFKFLSTADMVQHWNLLKFELFLVIWIFCAALLGLYQLGILNWKGAQGRPGVVRLGLATLSLAFAGYMTYGLVQYRPMGLLSGIAPPVHYNFFRPMDCPHGLDCYHDFDEALAVAKLENKPLFVDFTGYGCVNCRKMEETVWTDPEVIRRLRENYVVVSLYVDDRERLFPDNKFAYLQDAHTGQKIRTVGDKWSSFQINNFQRNSQPWYVLMDNDGTSLLNEPRGYTPDKDIYRDFLDCGYNAFERQKDNKSRQMLSEK